MILSHGYRFIFLKTNKTAGTSIEIALSKFCGPDDIITPVVPKDEAIRKELGYPGPRNYLAPPWDYRLRDVGRLLLKLRGKRRYYNHIPARKLRALVGQEVWDGYFKFCFVRNPWDRLVSHYYWKFKSEPRPAFSEYMKSEVPLLLRRSGFDLYTIDGEVAVDRVCRYENLTQELEEVRTQLGIPEELVLPRAKSGYRKDRGNYRDLFGQEEKAMVADLFSDEIKLFGYEF